MIYWVFRELNKVQEMSFQTSFLLFRELVCYLFYLIFREENS